MKVLLDTCVWGAAVGDLQSAGHDVIWAGEWDVDPGKKIFVHCAANKRVSTFVSLFGQARLGWSLDMAEACIRRVWKPNAAWADFIMNSRRTLSEHI